MALVARMAATAPAAAPFGRGNRRRDDQNDYGNDDSDDLHSGPRSLVTGS